MNVNEYFRRIGVTKSDVSTDLVSLALLQKQHLLNVPFENLDIHWGIKITLDLQKIYRKIVERGRGGFCYELNGLFQKLLTEVGFRSRIISARVSDGSGGFGEEFDHLAILVKIGDAEFLADVGFGDFAAGPLRFALDVELEDDTGTFQIKKYDDEYFEVAKKSGNGWKGQYIFRDLERDLAEFRTMCEFHQTSPHSHFTRGKMCSLMTHTGRKTLTENRFIVARNGQKTETDIDSDKDFREILWREFMIEAPFQN